MLRYLQSVDDHGSLMDRLNNVMENVNQFAQTYQQHWPLYSGIALTGATAGAIASYVLLRRPLKKADKQREEYITLTEENTQIKHTLDLERKERAELQGTFSAFQKDMEKKMEEYGTLQKRHTETQKTLQEKERDYIGLSGKLTELEGRMERVSTEHTTLSEYNTQLDRELDRLQRQHTELDVQYKAAERARDHVLSEKTELEKQYHGDMERLNAEIDSLHKERANVERERNDSLRKYAILDAEYRTIQEESGRVRAELATIQERLTHSQRELGTTREEYIILREQHTTLGQRLAQSEEEGQKWKGQYDAKDAEFKRTVEAHAALLVENERTKTHERSLEDEVEHLRSDFERAHTDYRADISHLEGLLAAEAAARKDAEAGRAQLEQSLGSMLSLSRDVLSAAKHPQQQFSAPPQLLSAGSKGETLDTRGTIPQTGFKPDLRTPEEIQEDARQARARLERRTPPHKA